MNIWSIALAAMIFGAAVVGQLTDTSYVGDAEAVVVSGTPVTTARTPSTP